MGKIIKRRVEYGGSSNSAENIKYDDTKNVKQAIDEVKSDIAGVKSNLESCFQSVSNGKALVASAITDQGIKTDATATFEVMANNIRSLLVSKLPDNISASCQAYSRTLNNWSYARYANPVDLTHVRTITITYTLRAYFEYDINYYDYIKYSLGVSAGNSGDFSKKYSNTAWTTSYKPEYQWSTSGGTINLDVSNLTGMYYIGCGVCPGDDTHGNYDGEGMYTTITGVTFNK